MEVVAVMRPAAQKGRTTPETPTAVASGGSGGPPPAPERAEREETPSKEQSPETKPDLTSKKNWYKGKKKSKGSQTTANVNKAVPQPQPKQKTPRTNNTKGK
jgi:hypothetical protein